MLGKIILFLMAFSMAFAILLSGMASAQLTNSTCQSDSISRFNSTITTYNNGTFTGNVTELEDSFCKFGCNYKTGVCNEVKQSDSILISILTPLIASFSLFALAFLWPQKRSWDMAYRMFFLFFGLVFVVTAVGMSVSAISMTSGITASFINLSENSVINSSILIYLVMAMFVLFMLVEIVLLLKNHMDEIRNRKDNDDKREYEDEKEERKK